MRSKNWDFTELLLRRGQKLCVQRCRNYFEAKKKKKRRANAAFVPSANLFFLFFFLNWTCYCCSNQHSASYMAYTAAALPVSTTQSHQRTEQASGPERRWINEQTYCWPELNTTVAAGRWKAWERPGATVRLSLPHSSKGEGPYSMHISPSWEVHLGYDTCARLPKNVQTWSSSLAQSLHHRVNRTEIRA